MRREWGSPTFTMEPRRLTPAKIGDINDDPGTYPSDREFYQLGLPGRKPNFTLAYIAVGLLNTVIGYVIGVVCLFLLLDWLPTPVVGLIATMIAVVSNFILYKRLVFKTKASWRGELIKFVQVYGFATAIGLAVLTVCIDVAESFDNDCARRQHVFFHINRCNRQLFLLLSVQMSDYAALPTSAQMHTPIRIIYT